jgi:hypothetical protein
VLPYSNCLIYALTQWCRYGGYVAMRTSHWGWFPHFLWSPDLVKWWAYVPLKPARHWCPPLLFRGQVEEDAS